METVFIVITHKFDTTTKREIARISKELQDDYPFFVYYDNSARDVPIALDAPLIPFDFQKISTQFPFRMGTNIIPGNAYVVYTELPKLFPKTSHFWIVEYDVRFSGNWRHFLKSFEQSQSDFMGCHLRYRHEIPDWEWWPSFQNRLNPTKILNDEFLVRSFSWISRVSRRALEVIRHECIQNGWSGHAEVLIPSLLLQAGLRVEEIGGNSGFTPALRRNLFYSSEYGLSYPSRNGDYGLGGNRYAPRLLFWGYRNNRLYHPIKTPRSYGGYYREFLNLLKYKRLGMQDFIVNRLPHSWHFLRNRKSI